MAPMVLLSNNPVLFGKGLQPFQYYFYCVVRSRQLTMGKDSRDLFQFCSRSLPIDHLLDQRINILHPNSIQISIPRYAEEKK